MGASEGDGAAASLSGSVPRVMESLLDGNNGVLLRHHTLNDAGRNEIGRQPFVVERFHSGLYVDIAPLFDERYVRKNGDTVKGGQEPDNDGGGGEAFLSLLFSARHNLLIRHIADMKLLLFRPLGRCNRCFVGYLAFCKCLRDEQWHIVVQASVRIPFCFSPRKERFLLRFVPYNNPLILIICCEYSRITLYNTIR